MKKIVHSTLIMIIFLLAFSICVYANNDNVLYNPLNTEIYHEPDYLKTEISLMGLDTVKSYSKSTQGDTYLSKNFKVKEFACKDGSDTILIDSELVTILQNIRDHFNSTVTITSAYRTAEYNATISGASKNSNHVKGMAADIVISGITPAEVAKYAETIGVRGIGKYSGFVHVDTRATKYYWITSGGSSTSVSTHGGTFNKYPYDSNSTPSTPEEPETTEPPTNVSITASSNFISTGQSVTFNFSQSGATYWYIDIQRDGSREHLELVTGKSTYTYTFQNEGKYKVWIKAAKNDKWTNEYVTVTVSNSKPYNVSITPDTTYISTDETVNFSFTVENAAYWYFIVEKDGVNDIVELVTAKYEYSYTFKEEGVYTVKLQTANVNGWTNTSTKITVSDYPTDVSITASSNFISTGQSITFDFTQKGAAYWYIDIQRDGSREHLELVTGKSTYTYTFQNEGKYKVWIKAAKNDKWTNEYVTVTVSNSKPYNVSITPDTTYISTDETVNFSFTVENAAYWYFIVEKDGVNDIVELVTAKYEYSYTFKEEGVYTVKLQTANVNGWTNTSVPITVAKQPQKPHLIDINTYYPDGNETILNWKKTGATTHYNLYIHKMDEFGVYKYYEDIFYAEPGIVKILEPGKYRVFVQATNSKYFTDDGSTWLYTNSDYVYFEVMDENKKFISSNVKKNDITHTIEVELHNITAPYDILIAGYKGNQFVTVKRVPHNKQNSPYTLEGDIDKIKVMVWDDLSTLKPLCKVEEITNNNFIIE